MSKSSNSSVLIEWAIQYLSDRSCSLCLRRTFICPWYSPVMLSSTTIPNMLPNGIVLGFSRGSVYFFKATQQPDGRVGDMECPTTCAMPSQSLQSGRYQYLVISSVVLTSCVCPAENLKFTCGSKCNPLFSHLRILLLL